MIKCNFHTHTTRCRHAAGADESYVRAALAGGFTTLGMADHTPWPFASGYESPVRMLPEELPGYIASFRALREKYHGQIELRIGVEAEWFPRYADWVDRMSDAGVEYFILGQHYADSEEEYPYVGSPWAFDDDHVRRYADACALGLRTGRYSYVCHPDLFMRHRPADSFNAACEAAADTICQAALEANVPLEYNLLGLSLQNGDTTGYPNPAFWTCAAKWHNKAILGMDAHKPEALENTALWQRGIDDLKTLGYERVETLEIPVKE